MKKIVRLTESDLARVVKRVINEFRDGSGNTLFILTDEDISGYGFYDVVEKLMGGYGKVNKKELLGKWQSRLTKDGVAFDFYVNGREVFSEVLGPMSHFSEFLKTNVTNGNFKIMTRMYNHPEAGPTPKYDIYVMR